MAPPEKRRAPRLGLALRLLLAPLPAVAAGAAAAAFAVRWTASPVVLAAISVSVALPLAAWSLHLALHSLRRRLAALEDGVRSFADGDFSLRLATTRDDEIGRLQRLYNRLAESFHEERSGVYQKELLLDTVLEATPTAIVITNPRDRILFANRAARDLFVTGRRPQGQRFEDILGSCPPELLEALAGGSDALFTVHHDGESEAFHVARRTFQLHGLTHTLYLVEHLTPQLHRQEVAVWKKVIRLMGHELNNSLAPVASLARSAGRLLERPESAEQLREALTVIEDRALHLRDFLEGYAHFARLPMPRKQTVAWAGFLADLRQLYAFRLAGEPPPVPGFFDPAQLQQALINLLKNAREAGSPDDETVVAVEATHDAGTRIRVLDRGRGMNDEQLREALLPFYSSKESGTGLGLPLCREIVEAHGGYLRLRRRDGGGLAISCWLPSE